MRVPVITSVILLCATVVFAQESEKVTPKWQSLFNGKDLSGWKKIGKEKWIVEDGAIYGEGVTAEYGYLATEKTYQDFELSLKFKCEASGNSGVYIHTTFEPGTPKVIKGRQVEIDRAIGHHTGGIYGDGKGWIVWPAPELETVIKPDDWNSLQISVVGKRYITHLNGKQMIDFTYPSPGATTGVIALQLHSGGEGRMRFKDLKIRDLSDKSGKSSTAK
ncbi:MAG: DUF1080 domain-containing protein [Planctomycetes bacterium]|nr:DUF1080 domain-containing protein [Planctomycetota bacterium]